MHKLTPDEAKKQKWLNSILESAVVGAVRYIRSESGNTPQPRVEEVRTSVVNNTALIERSAEDFLNKDPRFKFILERSFNVKINLLNDSDVVELSDLIENKNICLKSIESISFGEVNQNNIAKLQKLLNTIFDNQENLFSGLKQIIFGEINNDLKLSLIIPGFKGLETLIFGGIMSPNIPVVSYCPALKRLESKYSLILMQIKEIIEFKKITFSVESDSVFWLLEFINSGNVSWLGCVKTMVIDEIYFSRYKYFNELVDCICSSQKLFTNLKKIILDNRPSIYDLSEASQLPKFWEGIEMVYFSRNVQVSKSF